MDSRFRDIARYAAMVVTAFGALVVVAWFAGLDALTSIVPGLPGVKFNTGFAFLLLGGSLLVSIRSKPGGPAAIAARWPAAWPA